MGDFLLDLLFDPVPRSVRGKYKLAVILLRITEALILLGVGWEWYTSEAFGASFRGVTTGTGRVILIAMIASDILSWWRPFKAKLSQYALGMALAGIITFMGAYGFATQPHEGFVILAGAWITFGGGLLRFVVCSVLANRIGTEEKVLAMLGLDPRILATWSATEEDPTP